jgi:hypothetical protein
MEPARMTKEEEVAFLRRRRSRNIGMIVVLVALVIIFYLITMAKLTSSVS